MISKRCSFIQTRIRLKGDSSIIQSVQLSEVILLELSVQNDVLKQIRAESDADITRIEK